MFKKSSRVLCTTYMFVACSAWVAAAETLVHPFSPETIASTGEAVAQQLSTITPGNADGAARLAAAKKAALIVGPAAGIAQGAHGDCWFESSLAAVVRSPQGQQLVSNMIVQKADDVYEVTFPDEPSKSYPVTKRDFTEYEVRDKALWASIVEVASIKRFPQLQGKAHGANTHGIPTVYTGLKAMTGHEPKLVIPANLEKLVLAQLIDKNLKEQIPMVVASRSPQKLPAPGVVPNHVYTVIDFDAPSDTITLRNPFGKSGKRHYPELPALGEQKYGVTDAGGGLIKMNLSDFGLYFRYLASASI